MEFAAKQDIQIIEHSPPVHSTVLTPIEMLDRAVSQGANIETLDRLMSLQERWEKSQSRKEFDAAIAAAKSDLKPVIKNRQGHNSRYADFAKISTAVDPVLSKNGLSYRFRTMQDDRIHVTCILSHKSGHSEENTVSGPPDASGSKNAIQAIGSTLTYLQRYSLLQALGLAVSEDDDGRGSGDDGPISQTQLNELEKIISEVSADNNKFLKFLKIEKLSDLPAYKFDAAKSALEGKRSKR
jgi:hypothetical protein